MVETIDRSGLSDAHISQRDQAKALLVGDATFVSRHTGAEKEKDEDSSFHKIRS